MYNDALTTKERVKDRLQITATNFDSVLDRMILSITARIEQMTGRRFAAGTYTNELHDGGGVGGVRRSYLIVKNAPVQQITALEWRAGTEVTPNWTAVSPSTYYVDYNAGAIHFPGGMPLGFRNMRVSYVGGFDTFELGVSSFWNFNVTPAGTVDGANLTFTLPEAADQIIVYADGMREQSATITHTNGTSTFTLAAGRAPSSTIAVDYLSTLSATAMAASLPQDIVEVCEVAVCRMFNRRKSEGKQLEVFQESKVQWGTSIFTEEDMATIKNYRRGYNL